MIRLRCCLALGLLALPAAAPAADFATLVAQCASPDPRTAIAACTEIIAAGDDMGAERFTALTQRAAAELTLNEPDLTIMDDTAALAINPQNGQTFETRGRAYDLKSSFAQATTDEMRAVALLPHDPDALYWLGAFEMDAGSYNKSIVDETKAIALAPRYADAYIQRAEDEERLGESKADFNDLSTAVKVAPRYATAFILLGNFYFEQSRFAEGITYFDNALDLDPGNRFAKAYLGLSFESIGHPQQAIADLSAYIDDPATRADKFMRDCLDARGFAFLDAGDPDRAIGDFSTALKLDTQDYVAYGGLARAYRKKKVYELALQNDETAVKINPHYIYAHIGLSEIDVEQKNLADATLIAQKLVALTPKDGASWNRLCWFRAHIGQLNAALANCQKAVTLTPTDVNSWDSYGYVYLELHENALAVRYYSRALVIEPAFASSLYGRALAEQALGDKRHAEADRVAATRLDPHITADFGAL
jgi:tetratricopeptide (TPR) repeat protein